ncbi:MAG: beta-glucan endohydrolase [Frankiales bacterium]|nr:beta-glucan endohydrolase [Frankiales bacterium]
MLLAGAALLLLIGVVAVALTLPGVRSDLVAGRTALLSAQDDLGHGSVASARSHLAEAGRRASQADGRTHGLVWRAMAHVPVARRSVRELQSMSSALHVTTRDVLPPLLAVTAQPAWTGKIDAASFQRLQAPLRAAQSRLETTRRALRNAPHSDIAQITRPRRELDDALSRLAVTLGEAKVTADVLPVLVAGDKHVLLAVQNNAEPRATGGLLGAYGLIDVHDGAFRLAAIGPNNDLHDTTTPVVSLGEEYDDRYGRFDTASTWRSANLTPDTPAAGRILAGLWKAQTGQQVDAVLLVDPIALADLLGATGPVTLTDGTRVTEKNAVQVLLVDTYRRFSRAQDAERNAYLSETSRRVVDALARPGLDGARLVSRVSRAAASGHLQLVATDPSLESELRTARGGGALQADGPFLSVVTQDVGGSKLGAYLHRTVTYSGKPTGEAVDLGSGPVLEEDATVSVGLTNAAPDGLPSYVTARPDDPRAPVGQAKYWLSVYLGKEATLLGATLDGRPVEVETGTENGLTVVSLFLTVDRTRTRTLALHVRQPSRPGQPLTYRQQPLLRPDALVVKRQGAPLTLLYSR